MTRFDPAFRPRSSTLKGVLVNSVSTPALLSHGVEIVPAPPTMDDLRSTADRIFGGDFIVGPITEGL